jgi:hypothetical protein
MMSGEESSTRKYMECKELVLGVLGLWNTTMVNSTGSDWSSGGDLFLMYGQL